MRITLLGLIASLALCSCAQEAPKVARTTAGPTSAPSSTGTGANASETTRQTEIDPGSGQPVDMTIPAGPTTKALTVAAGPVTFDLASAKPALTGATVTATLAINAAVGTTPTSISLSNIAVKTSAGTGFVLYRPVMVLVEGTKETQYPMGVNINQKIPKARTVPLSNLNAISFENIAAGASIKLRFSALEPLADALLDGLPNYRECKAPASFKAVADALQPCKSCHSGLFTYDFMDKDMATACGQNLKIIDRTLSGNNTIPAIPAGTHHGVNAGAVSSAIGPWKTGEGL